MAALAIATTCYLHGARIRRVKALAIPCSWAITRAVSRTSAAITRTITWSMAALAIAATCYLHGARIRRVKTLTIPCSWAMARAVSRTGAAITRTITWSMACNCLTCNKTAAYNTSSYCHFFDNFHFLFSFKRFMINNILPVT